MNGSVAEWFIALVLKTSGLRGPGDSNSSASTKLNNNVALAPIGRAKD